jgi:hypothetical protein
MQYAGTPNSILESLHVKLSKILRTNLVKDRTKGQLPPSRIIPLAIGSVFGDVDLESRHKSTKPNLSLNSIFKVP